MYPDHPIWYRKGLPEILRKFSDIMRDRLANVSLLPCFPTPSYDSDGVHLSAYSGLEFVLHLFDSDHQVLDQRGLDSDSRTPLGTEATCMLEDRVMVLEQDARCLNTKFELKAAFDAELLD